MDSILSGGENEKKNKFARVQKEREAGSVQFFLFFFWALKDCFALNPPIKNWICFLDGKFFLFTASACLKLDFLPFLGVHSKHCWFSFLVMHEIWVGVFRPLKEIYEFAFFYLGTFRTYSNTSLSALSALFPRLLRTFFSGKTLGLLAWMVAGRGGWEDRGRRNFLCSVSPPQPTIPSWIW